MQPKSPKPNIDKVILLEPTETIKIILDWVTKTPDAYANISYNHDIGWNITTFINDDKEMFFDEQE